MESHPSQTTDHSDVPELNNDECSSDVDPESASCTVLQGLSLLLLELESTYNASVRCIDALVEGLFYISCAASVEAVKNIIDSALKSNKCTVNHTIIKDLAEQLRSSHPISRALGAGGPLGSAFKRNKYFKEHFQFVDPIEYILDAEQKGFQYVPVLKTLQEVLKNKDFVMEAFSRCSSSTGHFKSIFYGTCFKDNDFYAVEETRLSIIICVDEFEVCNPLGTS